MVNPLVIKVLLIDDSIIVRNTIRGILSARPDFSVVGEAEDKLTGVAFAKKLMPDVIVTDVKFNGEDAFNTISELQSIVPHVKIIILSAYTDPATMRQALLAGINDFIAKPPESEELIAAVYNAGIASLKMRERQAGRASGQEFILQASENLGKVVLVYGAKGTPGSSIVSASIASALAQESAKVALMDADLQFGDISILLNINWQFSVLSLTDQLFGLEPEEFSKVIFNHTQSNLHVMVSPNRVEAYDLIRGDQFLRVLEFMRNLYSYTVVDLPTVVNDVSLSAMDTADTIVLLASQDLAVLKNTLLFLNVCDQLKIDRAKIIFALVQYDKKIPLEKDRISTQLKQPVDVLIPPDPSLISRSITRGIPFYLADREAFISHSISQMVGLIRERISKKVRVEGKTLPV